MPIIFGLLFAYIFGPVYKTLQKISGNKNTAAFILVLGLMLMVIVPTIYFVPVIVNQAFDIFVMMDPHVNVLETSQRVQEAVTEAIDKMVGLSVETVNVHVEDVIYTLDETA